MNTTYHKECLGLQEPRYQNEYLGLLKRSIDINDEYGFIFVIDRGDCYFVEKVEFAESIGAKAVLIIDHTPESLFTMWMPDDWDDDINIPSVLLGEINGKILYQHLGVCYFTLFDLIYEHYTYIELKLHTICIVYTNIVICNVIGKTLESKKIHETMYPSPGLFNWTIATIQWGLPHKDGRVEWSVLHATNILCGHCSTINDM